MDKETRPIRDVDRQLPVRSSQLRAPRKPTPAGRAPPRHSDRTCRTGRGRGRPGDLAPVARGEL